MERRVSRREGSGVGSDNFSMWHKCKRWTERGLTCPFNALEEEGSEEDADARPSGARSGAAALQAAVGSELAGVGNPFMDLVGPLLALFTVLRGVQTLGPGLKMGRVQAAGLSEEATVRVLRPQVPAREGPTPARPAPSRVPVASRFGPPRLFGGGGFFSNQAAELQMMMGRGGFTKK